MVVRMTIAIMTSVKAESPTQLDRENYIALHCTNLIAQ